jgi:hypothetical protein
MGREKKYQFDDTIAVLCSHNTKQGRIEKTNSTSNAALSNME